MLLIIRLKVSALFDDTPINTPHKKLNYLVSMKAFIGVHYNTSRVEIFFAGNSVKP